MFKVVRVRGYLMPHAPTRRFRWAVRFAEEAVGIGALGQSGILCHLRRIEAVAESPDRFDSLTCWTEFLSKS